MNSDLVSYYKSRAAEYDKVYLKPERQNDLLLIEQVLQDTFRGKEVFEIACGTGYWTERIAKTANAILATDINDAVVEIAKSRSYTPASVGFRIADLFHLTETDAHESLFGGFIWSHIKLQDLDSFIEICNGLIEKNGTIVFLDNKYIEDSSLPIAEVDSFGNTYQARTLEDGTAHKVLKNFPTKEFIREILAGKASDVGFTDLEYYWLLTYRTK
jgi:2-polyprenyl-3-methyl-5-hydroxy-6-metoxy-1,4-benzoquinol methylase